MINNDFVWFKKASDLLNVLMLVVAEYGSEGASYGSVT